MPLTTVNPALLDTQAQYTGFKNRIINGAMVIDQRNAGASVTPANTYTVDRWQAVNTQPSKFTVQRNAGSVTPPVGFTNYLGATSSSAYSVLSGDTFLLRQFIEGFNTADLAWGTASAATVTLSFWVRSSLTGTFGGALSNNAGNRAYPFSYTINSANTWEFETITIPGDITGTWDTGNTVGIDVRFGLGSGSSFTATANTWGATNAVQPTGTVSVVGTNGATFYITGVQLEKGSTATSFDYRPYGTELSLCQRYFEKSYDTDVAVGTSTASGHIFVNGSSDNGGNQGFPIRFAVTKRTTPTMTAYRDGGTSGIWDYGRSGASGTNTVSFNEVGATTAGRATVSVGANWVACFIYGHWTASAEL